MQTWEMTPKQYRKHRIKVTANRNHVTQKEVAECYPEFHTNKEHINIILEAAKAGYRIPDKVLNKIPTETKTIIFKFYGRTEEYNDYFIKHAKSMFA